MEKENRKLVLLMALALLVTAVLGLFMDQSNGPVASSGNYKIRITEICAKNESIIADNDGVFRDYVELYNAGPDVSLAGFTLTDGQVECEPFGNAVLHSGEYRLVFLGAEVTGFSLGASGGDAIQLKDPAGGIVVQTNVAAMTADQVMTLHAGIYRTSYEATPGFPNNKEGLKAFRQGIVSDAPRIVISEILAENASACSDEQGNYCDVIELHNVSGQPLSLGGFWLSDKPDRRFRFRLPDVTVPVDGYLLVYCDGKNYTGEKGEIHANFGLSLGDVLCLTDKDGSFITTDVTFPGEDCSAALNEAGTFEAAPPSLGWPNTEDGIYGFAQSRIDEHAPLVISEVLLSDAGVPCNGALEDVVEIANRSDQTVSTDGWYLTDDRDPYQYALPEQELAPGEYLVLVCSSSTTGFSLREGETVTLTTPDYRISSSVTCVPVDPGRSICLQTEGYAVTAPSLGYANDTEGCEEYAMAQLPGDLRISEVMTANRSYLLGPYGVGCDWVEFYNASTEPVFLGEYCLTDDPLVPEKYPLPQITLAAGKYCVIMLAEKPDNLLKEYAWIPMTLSSEGEGLYLSRGGAITDHVVIPALVPDVSYGRAQGCGVFSMLASVTPGEANAQAAEAAPMPTAVTAQGVYEGVEYLDVELAGEGEIYYTTDCTAPGADAIRYSGPIRITKTTVIRAVCRRDGMIESRTLDLTYLLNEKDNLPAVTLVLESDDLWSAERGIYTRGGRGEPEYPHVGANYFQKGERSACVSLFEKDGTGFTSPCGLRIFGGYSRAQDVKALSCSFRDSYGMSELNYPLFGEEGLDTYEAFVLRAGGQDVFTGRIRDVLMTSLLADATNVPVQKYRPVALYLNGQYWGVYFIREKINENYVAGNYNVRADSVVLTDRNGFECPEYMELFNYAVTHDLSQPEHYAYISGIMDIDEYIDVMVAQMCIGNHDNGNVKFFRYPGGKWTWVFFDTDHGLTNVAYYSPGEHLSPGGTGFINDISTGLINALMRNKEFKDKFLTRMAWQLNNIWTPENINARIDYLESLVKEDMVKDYIRWGYDPAIRQRHIDSLRGVANGRRTVMIGYVQSYFDLSDDQMRSYGFVQ